MGCLDQGAGTEQGEVVERGWDPRGRTLVSDLAWLSPDCVPSRRVWPPLPISTLSVSTSFRVRVRRHLSPVTMARGSSFRRSMGFRVPGGGACVPATWSWERSRRRSIWAEKELLSL